jgi:hypothetical protein
VPHQLTSRLIVAALCSAVCVAGLAGCGKPPQPLPTAPPQGTATSSESAGPSFAAPGALPSGPVVPTVPGGPIVPVVPVVPTTLPPGGRIPTYPPVTTTAPTTVPTPTPSPAAKCTHGPSKAQVLAVVEGKPGIPDEDLDVNSGPFCSGDWQFTELGIKGKDDDEVDPLLVVTKGKPSSLTLVEAGADVCSDRVQKDAPPRIRVRACGF